jgi:hypothetical protein
VAGRSLSGLSQALQAGEAVHGDRPLGQIALQQRHLGWQIRRGRIAGHLGIGRRMRPLDERVDRAERRDGTPGILFAQPERSGQYSQLPELCRRPLDAPARRKAPIRELRDVPLQTDR